MQGKSHSEELWLKKIIYHAQGQQHKNIAASRDGGPKPSANATAVASGKLWPTGTCITVTL